MTSVTSIVQVDNLSVYDVYICNGADANKTTKCPAQFIYKCSIWVPWIATESQEFKVITLQCGKDQENLIYIFQDFKETNTVKFSKVTPFKYNDGKHELMQYSPSGAGEKYLQIIDDYDPRDHTKIMGQSVYLRQFDV